jgi:uncharacterized protein (DUF305 family)
MEHQHKRHERPYLQLALMAALSFIAMYVLMYAMVARWADIYPSLSQAYMAALMAAPMVLIDLALMRRMYRDRRANAIVLAVSVLVFVGAFAGIRRQAFIGDDEFLRSMIPHHSGAVLMCEQAPIRDPEIQQLCAGIIASQEQEIAAMRAIRARL